MSKGYKCK